MLGQRTPALPVANGAPGRKHAASEEPQEDVFAAERKLVQEARGNGVSCGGVTYVLGRSRLRAAPGSGWLKVRPFWRCTCSPSRAMVHRGIVGVVASYDRVP